MLLNEFLKAHKKAGRLETTIARQQEQIEALTAGQKKVTARIKMSQQTAQIAGNN
jgi:plasmid maintenance system antidote protein VapI